MRSGVATLLRLVLLVAALGAVARNTSAAEPLSFYVNYAARVPTAPLIAHALSIVHPDAVVDLAPAHAAGNRVLAYLSVGEVAVDAPYRAEVARRGLPFAGRNEIWKSDLIDLSDARWADFLVTQLAAAAVVRGFDGFFLDTLDSVQLIAGDAARTAALRAGLIDVVRRLRAAFPQKTIVINRGFFAFAELREAVDGVLAESLFETHDFATRQSRTVAAAETQALTTELRKVAAAGRAVYVLDYTDPADAPRARAAAQKIRALGFSAFVSTPALSGESLAPLRPVARRICAFFGNLTTVQEDQVKWPAESFAATKLQAPLEWLGYEVDYFKLLTAADLPSLNSEYRAIVLPRFWEIPRAIEPQVVDWLLAQRAAGRKILMFGVPPFREPEQRLRFLAGLGIAGTGATVAPPLTVKVDFQDSAMLDFEAPVAALPSGFHNFTAPPDARRLLTLSARRKDGTTVNFDPVFTCAWGGAALDPYTVFRRADFREIWHIDPFAFLELALGPMGAPVPDTTTREGLRTFLSHIDGDGFSNFSRTDPGQRSAEVVRDRILKKYPLPVTVSVIEAELRGLIRNQRIDDSPALEAIARGIFALPHIEAASHSFSHPFFWIQGDRTESFYDAQALDLKIDYPRIALRREIVDSVRYINETLAPPDRPVRLFLWTGNCRPPPEALAMVRELGLENMNGGDTLLTARNRTLNAVAPRSMPWGDELQIYAPNQNENVYTNNWRGPLFGTFTHVLETFALTESPRRLKPVNVYYHFYSGDHAASLQALETIHDWAVQEPLHAIAASHYARIARDARATAVFEVGDDRWLAVNRGESRTLRLPAALAARLDLARSRGVTGWKIERDQAYVHTDGSAAVTLALAATAATAPRFESSSGEIVFRERTAERWRFTARDLRPVKVRFAGFAAGARLQSTVGGDVKSIVAAADGSVSLTLPSDADATLEMMR